VRGWVPRPAKILVVTAHPDDEILLAPFLDAQCRPEKASCAILVLTRGEAGGDPDVRTAEMAASAAALRLRLMQWSLPDLMEPWPDRDALRLQIAGVIAAERPDMILTFDPGHGSTGHPAHRETGALVRDSGAANVWYLETLVTWSGGSPEFSAAVPNAWRFRGDWSTVVRAAMIHASQFSNAVVASLAEQDESQRYVWLEQAF